MTRLLTQHDVVIQNPLADSSTYMSQETTIAAVGKSVTNAALRILQAVSGSISSSSNNSDASSSSSSVSDHHYPFEDNPAAAAANFTSGYNHSNINHNNNMMDHISVHSASSTTTNMIVVGILIAIIIILSMIFLGMVIPPLLRYIQRQIPVSQKRIDERYETIEGWLISKVRLLTCVLLLLLMRVCAGCSFKRLLGSDT
jgi:di/tricarboxylate transporter